MAAERAGWLANLKHLDSWKAENLVVSKLKGSSRAGC